MQILHPSTGALTFGNILHIHPDISWTELQQQLNDSSIEHTTQTQQQWKTVNIQKLACDEKIFHLEIHVDQERITGLMMDFRCSGDPWDELEAWLTEQAGNERTFVWGKASRIEHPKFGVPLISIYYKKG